MRDARIADELEQWMLKLDTAPPGREKQVKALKKANVKNPFAVAWASYDKHKDATAGEEEPEAEDNPDEERPELA